MFGNTVANMFFKPGQAPLFDNPKNYGLDYEDVEFKARDGVTLRGWLIPGDPNKVIIQSHFGTACCRAGYTNEGKGWIKGYDEDIHFLNQAKYLHEAGYTVLMYDFRNHGESDVSDPPWISWGTHEAKDVIGAVDFIATHPVYKEAAIGLFSICMGQGASIEAFGLENGLRDYPQIKAMVSVQPMDYPTFVKAMGLPGFVQKSVRRVMQKRANIDVVDSSWFPHVKDVTVPTMVIQNRNDGYLDEAFVNQVFNNLAVEKEMVWIEIPKRKNANQNRIVAYDWIGKNPDKILEWFGKYL